MYQAITFTTAILIVALVLVIFAKKSDKSFSVFLKITTILFCAVGFFRFMLSDSFIYVIKGGYLNDVFYDDTDVLQTILRWGYYLNYAILPMAVFFDSRLFKNFASYVCLPFAILSCVFFNDYMVYFLDSAGRGLHLAPSFRYFYFIFELALAMIIPILMQIREKHVFRIKDKTEWMNFLIALPFILILMFPVYVPQSLFGYSRLIAEVGKPFHIGWIVILLVATLALYYAFRYKSYKDRYLLVVFLSIVLFFHYDSLYLMGFSIPRLPIQLCNMAAYFYMIAIPFKLKKMFQFCFLANVTGALIAIIVADFSMTGAFGFWNMHYILEHSLVLMIPALAMGLRIFPRSERSSLKYMCVGFTCYFIFCLASGTILNGYADVTGFRVNYFFLFDLEKIYGYLPFLSRTENMHLQFGRFEFYPLLIIIIYAGFQLICLLYYLLVKALYKIEDDHIELRKSSIDLYEKISGKTSKRPKEFID